MSNYSLSMLITGGNGQLGSALRNHELAKHSVLHALSRHELDITNPQAIEQAITSYEPDIIVNTAAFTAVDKAEQEMTQAMQINHEGAKNIAQVCNMHRIPLLHISTDYIFDGKKNSPYTEEDLANPINFYGKSKWLSEEAVRTHCQYHIILRVSGIFSEYGNNFLKTILKLAQEKKELNVVDDQLTCPTYANDIAAVIFSLTKSQMNWGTYHFCNEKPISWYDFALAIIEEAKQYQTLSLNEIKPIKSDAYGSLAKRPSYSVLDCSKIEKEVGIKQTSWEKAMKQLIVKWSRGCL